MHAEICVKLAWRETYTHATRERDCLNLHTVATIQESLDCDGATAVLNVG